MQQFEAQLVVVRNNAHCVAIKAMIKSTKGLRLVYNQHIFKRQEIEMKYMLIIEQEAMGIEAFMGHVRPASVLNPVINLIKQTLEARGASDIQIIWGAHIPTLGMLPLVYMFWMDAGMTIYIKR